MRFRTVTAWRPAFCVVFICAALVGSQSSAADDTQTFIDGLRQRGLYDIALDLLETLRDSPRTSKDVRETLDYQFGATLIGGARQLPTEQREEQLEKAREHLEKFLADYPKHRLAESAKRNLVDMQIEHGEALINDAHHPGRTAMETQWLLDRARKMLEEAQKSLTEIDARLVKKKQYFNKLDTSDPALIEQLHQLVSEMMLTRLSLAKTYYDIAHTYPPGGKEHVLTLRKARDEFAAYYWKYNRWQGGYAFRLEQGRCLKELGEYERAIEVLAAMAIPGPADSESFRIMRTTALKMALDTYLLPQVKQYKDAWDLFQECDQSMPGSGMVGGDVSAVKCLGGEAALELAREIEGVDPQQARLRGMYQKRAKELLSQAARYPGEYQRRARLKLSDPLLAGDKVQIEPPKSYEEARGRAKIAWDQSRLPNARPDQVDRLRAEAAVCIRYALEHPAEETNVDELNAMRWQLAYLDWIEGDYYSAAAIGEFLAHRYPDRQEGCQGVEIALAAYNGLLQESPPGTDNDFEKRRIARLAEFASKHWPNSKVADDAWITLIRLALADKDPTTAVRLRDRLHVKASRRGEADLLAGQALWIEYLRLSRLPEERQPSAEDMAELLAQAHLILAEGVGRLEQRLIFDGKVSYPLAAGTLALAQICLERNQGRKAVEWLENPTIGAYTLARGGDETAGRGNFRVETFKAALRAFVTADQLQSAEEALEELEKAAPADNLTQIYIAIGRDIEKSLKRQLAEGDRAAADQTARGFDLFLSRIANRPANQITFGSLYWAAEAFVDLGDSLSPGDGPLSADGQKYYRKAALAYDRIINICREDEEFAPREGVVNEIRLRLAKCLRRLGKYEGAMDILVEMLAEQNNLIDVQIEAALTYQGWGEIRPGYYLLAIRGGRRAELKNGEIVRLVWGWAGIGAKVQFSRSHQDIFYTAKYNQALCRMKYAQSLEGKEKLEQLRRAEKDILLIQRLRPDMGGKKWRDQYDSLLREIQGLLGAPEDQRGLEAFEKKMAG